MRRLPLLVLVGLLPVIGACGQKAGVSVGSAPLAASSVEVPEVSAPPSTSVTAGKQLPLEVSRPAGTRTGGATAASRKPPATKTNFIPKGQSPGFPFDLKVQPTCIARGGTLLVSLTTRPHSFVSMAGKFADDRAHNAYTVGYADPTGNWQWSKELTAEIPSGPAQFVISATDRSADSGDHGARSNGESATTIFEFEVKEKC